MKERVIFIIFIMQTQRKEQGFIIRKTKNIETEKVRNLSQQELPNLSHTHRSPGTIRKIRFKEDIGFIKINPFYDNPESVESSLGVNFGLKYNYQQSPNELNQKDDLINSNSFQEVDGKVQPKTYGLNIQDSIQLLKKLKYLNYALQHRTCPGETLSAAQQYFQFIDRYELGNVSNFSIPSYRKKMIKDSLLYQRVSVLLICFVEGIIQKFSQTKSYLLNLNTYSIDNLLLRMTIITKGKHQKVLELLKGQKRQNYLNKGFDTIKNNNQIMMEAIIKLSKYENLFYENLKKIMKANKTMHVNGQLSAVLEYFAYFINGMDKNDKLPFLAVAPAPFLPQLQFPKYTLVIDVLEVFCSKNKKSNQTFRPFAEYFLDEMSQYYEIISFSDAMPNQINKIITLLDRKKHIKHRLYKYHLDKVKSFRGKDLSKIGRNLENVVMVDGSMEVEGKNTVFVHPWTGKKNDAELAELCPLLALIVLKKLNVQKAVKKIQSKMEENQKLGIKYLNCGLNFEDD